MNKQKTNGFTLVELIIVVTILGILSTIAFVSFQSYSKNARDSNRLETMSIVQKGISLNQVTTSKTLMPDDYTTVSASGNILGYEGIVGDGVSRGIQMSSIPKDPIRGENYIYYTNKDRNKVQVMGFLEGEEMVYLGIQRANAAGSGSKIPKVSGDRLGILLDVNNNRVTGSGVDILLTNSGTSYTTYFSNSDTLTSSGKDLYSKVYNRRDDLLKDTSLASLDDSLVGYWDMETLSGGKLKDLSKYGNDGTLSGGIIVGGVQGVKGKATYFDGISNFIYVNDSSILNFSSGTEYSIVTRIKLLSSPGTGNFYRFIQKASPSIYGYNLAIRPENSLDFWQRDSSGNNGVSATGGISLLDNNFHLIVGLRKNNSLILNLDGNNILSATGAIGDLTNTGTLNIGKNGHGWGADKYFNGIIDEIRIYKRSLSDSEIKELSNSTK